MIDWASDYLRNVGDLPVLPDLDPGSISQQLPGRPPEEGEGMDRIWEDFERLILPGVTHWNHPKFFAYFVTSASGPGILGDLLGAVLNVNAMLWRTCPASTELESTTLDWLREMLGLPPSFWGMICEGASLSTVQALAAARDDLRPLKTRERGLAGRAEIPRLRLYTSELGHSSIDKAALLLGLGEDSVRRIEVDREFRLVPEQLQRAIEEDRANGWLPFCVVANVGTTSVASVDPVEAIADICDQEDLWLHVDAAYGGSAAIVPELGWVLQGADRADSLVVNPHKWLFVPLELSVLYVRDKRTLARSFSLVPDYLTSDVSGVENYMEYGVTLGRRFRALKLWFVIRYFGRSGLAHLIEKHVRLARVFAGWVEQDPDFELVAPVHLSTVCFGLREDRSDESNLNLLESLNRSGKVFLSHTRINGRLILRLAVGGMRTDLDDVRFAWDLIKEKKAELRSRT